MMRLRMNWQASTQFLVIRSRSSTGFPKGKESRTEPPGRRRANDPSWPILACSFITSASRPTCASEALSSNALARFSMACRFHWVIGSGEAVLRQQLRDRPLAADRLKCDLGLEVGREPSAFMLDRPSHRSIHLGPSSQNSAPPPRLDLNSRHSRRGECMSVTGQDFPMMMLRETSALGWRLHSSK